MSLKTSLDRFSLPGMIVCFIIIIFLAVASKKDIVTVAIVVTSGTTVIYATLTYKMLRENRKMIQRPFFQAFVDEVIFELLTKVIDEEYFILSEEEQPAEIQFGILINVQALYDDFKDMHPDIHSKIKRYNKRIDCLKSKDFSDEEKKKLLLLLADIREDLKKILKKYRENYGVIPKKDSPSWYPIFKNLDTP
jgi:hypothetical protein